MKTDSIVVPSKITFTSARVGTPTQPAVAAGIEAPVGSVPVAPLSGLSRPASRPVPEPAPDLAPLGQPTPASSTPKLLVMAVLLLIAVGVMLFLQYGGSFEARGENNAKDSATARVALPPQPAPKAVVAVKPAMTPEANVVASLRANGLVVSPRPVPRPRDLVAAPASAAQPAPVLRAAVTAERFVAAPTASDDVVANVTALTIEALRNPSPAAVAPSAEVTRAETGLFGAVQRALSPRPSAPTIDEAANIAVQTETIDPPGLLVLPDGRIDTGAFLSSFTGN